MPNNEEPGRLAEPVDQEQAPRLPFPVVGIGASAGGLEAFIDLFKHIHADCGMAFVLIQHLPPGRDSLIAEILTKHTKMPVREITDNVRVECNHVYIIRPGQTLTIHGGLLHLTQPVEKRGHRHPVDDFFRSLAEEQRERAICVVMSGMGSNGSAGAQAIKAVGGVCIAQDPETAKFPSMPRSLIDSGLADFVLRPEEIPELLNRYCNHPYAIGTHTPDVKAGRERQALSEILQILRTRVRHDFTGYKKPTVLRRVERRMGLNQILSISNYVRLLRQNITEVTALSDDMMIHVTGFFRDPDVWELVRKKVILPLVASRTEEGVIRAWVSACSSGEEAYTLAMLLVEATEGLGRPFDIKVFATDTAERMLSHARSGLYPAAVESEISSERLERFFEKEDSTYRVRKELRELVVFAPQNILQDPPFSRLDICSCRNLLIYLEPAVQKRALALMHFGLREGGALLLGNSETVAGSEDLFESVDKKHRIYRRVGPTRHGTVDFPLLQTGASAATDEETKARALSRPSVALLTNRALLERYSPPSVVIDRDQRIHYFHGHTEQYLDQPRGEPTRELLTLARESIRGALRTAVQRALSTNLSASVYVGWLESEGGRSRLEVTVAPLELKPSPTYFIVSFHQHREATAPAATSSDASESHRELALELQRGRDELQSTIQELQVSNEEMKASNEEATSINEEMQSTNEELEMSKEELQSLNEELTTVNIQLQVKMDELEATTNDLTSLLSSTNIAVVFLDLKFRIRRFTPAVKDLIDLIPSDIGRPLNDLARKFVDEELLNDATIVLDQLVPREKEISAESGRVYVRRVQPYRTSDNRIEGVVITFVDIMERTRAETALRESEERYRLILDGVKEYGIFMLDPDGRVSTWSGGAEHVLGYSSNEALGLPFAAFHPGEDRAAGEPERELAEARKRGSVNQDGWRVRKNGSRFWASGALSAVADSRGRPRGFVKVLRDNTERRLSEEALRNAKRAADAANEAKDHFLATVSHELRTPLSAIVLWTSLIEDQKIVDPEQLSEALSSIKRSAEEQRELIEDLVDTARIVAGKLRLEIKSTHLPAVVRAGVDAARIAAKEKGVQIRENLDPSVDTVKADGSRLQQVVSNLVNNAVKFTPADGQVTVDLRRVSDNVQIVVSDTGIGIDPEILPHVFERFIQAEGVSTRTEGGLGLGLAIARQIVEMHGGQIAVESPGINRGTVFTVRIPLPATDSPSNGVVQTGKAKLTNVLKDRNVLIVEDVAATRRALAAVLHEAGAEVTAVDSAPAAWEAFERRRPDVVVSDLGLPTIDGYAFLRQIRDEEKSLKLPMLPAVALTAFAGDSINRKARENGFQTCLTKPIEPLLLVSTIASLLEPDHAKV